MAADRPRPHRTHAALHLRPDGGDDRHRRRAELDISSGLERGEWVINSSSDALRTGDIVRPSRAAGAQ